MKAPILLGRALVALLWLSPLPAFASAPGLLARVLYRSPSPGAIYVRPETNVILHYDRRFDPRIAGRIEVAGSLSGPHAGRTIMAENGRTVLFQPLRPFAWGESVEVSAGAEHFEFKIAASVSPLSGIRVDDDDPPPIEEDPDSIPFPVIRSTVYYTPSPGQLFLSNFGGMGEPFLMILDDQGQPHFKRHMAGTCFDFKVQPNGLLTYFDTTRGKFFGLDSSYAVVDSFACGNGYTTDSHELRLLPNGRALLMSYDPQVVDMSAIVPGGKSAANVYGLVIQELDADKNVIFQWRSWDHFQITDATHEDLTTNKIDYVHGNAIESDTDGNLLISSRHLDEITKIDRETGEVLWRWGGKNNQFTFIGDNLWFSHQHAIRRIPNGHVTLFDNGNFHDPPFSRAAEYDLDEVRHTATLVWQYRNTPDTFGSATGYVQRLSNGNTLICWGTGKPNLTEVTPGGIEVMELSLPPGQNTYRAFRQEWLPDAVEPRPSFSALSPVTPNPLRSATEMFIDLSPSIPLLARVYDVRGREVHGAAQVSPEGTGYRARIDLAGRASGVYLFQVSTPLGVQSRRIVHLD